MNIKPIGSRVLIAPIKNDAIINGIHVPQGYDTSNRGYQAGVVISIGTKARCACKKDGCDALLPGVEVGDRVTFNQFDTDGTVVNYDGKEYLLMNAKDIVAKIVP